MVYGRGNGWKEDTEVFSAHQVESVLDYCDVEVVSETSTHFLCYCPFHGNRVDPAFAADKSKGLWTCFNPSCGESGTLEQLLRRRKRLNPFQAARVIMKYRDAANSNMADRIEEAWNNPPEFVAFPKEPLDRMHEEFLVSDTAKSYMHGRHFTDDTLTHFRVGFSPEKWVVGKSGKKYLKPDMIIVPMHDPTGMPVGLIGRSIEGKRFKNSDNLPKSKTMFNLHRAKRHGATVIVVESSFDAMRIHQAGYPNVVALLGGGGVSPFHIHQLNRYFDTIVNMTDFDKKIIEQPGTCNKCKKHICDGHRAGRDLGHKISDALPNKKTLWAAYDDECVYPYKPLEGYRDHPAKDAGDMTDDEIRQCLKNAMSDYQYSEWDIEANVLPWE